MAQKLAQFGAGQAVTGIEFVRLLTLEYTVGLQHAQNIRKHGVSRIGKIRRLVGKRIKLTQLRNGNRVLNRCIIAQVKFCVMGKSIQKGQKRGLIFLGESGVQVNVPAPGQVDPQGSLRLRCRGRAKEAGGPNIFGGKEDMGQDPDLVGSISVRREKTVGSDLNGIPFWEIIRHGVLIRHDLRDTLAVGAGADHDTGMVALNSRSEDLGGAGGILVYQDDHRVEGQGIFLVIVDAVCVGAIPKDGHIAAS